MQAQLPLGVRISKWRNCGALQRVSQEIDWNRIDICRVTKGAHIEHL
jgi:hypothetical protein